jgi:hypothetical protein
MSFAAPMALLFALTVVPVALLYLLKRRAKRVAVPTLLFWEQVFEDTRPRSIWRRLRQWLSLSLQIGFLLLLVFALAQPVLPWQAGNAEHVVLIIDNGASMNGRRGNGTRLDEAKRQAIEVIDGLRFFDSMAILTAGGGPRVACPMTDHPRTLRAAVRAIEPTDAVARIEHTIAIARRIVETKANARIVMIGDQPADGVTVVPITGDTDNIAITRFAVRRSAIDPIGYAILVEVRNFGAEPVECRMELTLAGDVIDVFALSLAAGETWSHMIEQALPQGGRLVATIDRTDALSADNTAVAILPQRKPQRVSIGGEDNMFLAKVLEAIPLVQRVDADADVTVFHRKVPAVLPPGNVLVIDPAVATDLWSLGEPLQSPLVVRQDTTSPLMAHVRLDHVFMAKARSIKPTGHVRVLAEAATGEPIYFTIERDSGNVLVLAADLDQSDLPLRTAFAIMMTNAVNWFTGDAIAPIASTLIDASESDLRAPEDFVEHDVANTAGFDGRPMWFYLLAIACGLAAVEWWLYQRRWIS